MTVPKKIYDELEISNEVLCHMIDGALVIRPIKAFSEEIINDLNEEGYKAGEEFLKELAYRESQLNFALHKMIEETRNYKTYSNVDDFFEG